MALAQSRRVRSRHQRPKVEGPSSQEFAVAGATAPGTWRDHVIRYEFVRRLLPPGLILDIACGSGYGTAILADRGDCQVVGGDRSPEALSLASRHQEGRPIALVHLDAHALPFADGSFDAVCSIETLEHLTDASRFSVECCRVLRPGGMLLCSTPNRWLASGLAPRSPNPFHIREYTAKGFMKLVERHFGLAVFYGQHWLGPLRAAASVIGNTVLGLLLSVTGGGQAHRWLLARVMAATEEKPERLPPRAREIRPLRDPRASRLEWPYTVIAVARRL